MGLGVLTPRPGRFTFSKENRCPLYRMCGPQFRFGRVRKISRPPGFDPRTARSEWPHRMHYFRPPLPESQKKSEIPTPHPEDTQVLNVTALFRVANRMPLKILPVVRHHLPFVPLALSFLTIQFLSTATCSPIPLRNTNRIAFPVLIYDMPFTFT
jgi:hypothetical protein